MNYREGSVERYVADAAAGQPTPGGGSVSALAAALGAAMACMGANFTVGRRKYAAVEGKVRASLEALDKARERLLDLMQADTEAYAGVGAAYGMPRDTDEQKAARATAIQEALRGAMAIPLEIVRQCAVVGREAAALVGITNPNLITDVGVAAVLAEAASAGARLNVEINLKFMDDSALCARVRAELEEHTRTVNEARAATVARIREHLG